MMRLKTLNELAQLRESGFGQPYPRHGLSLLWWFAHECVDIDEDGCMTALDCNPEDGDFGFHPFHNTEGLLPETDLPYYEVGNLHKGLHLLPDRVTSYYDIDLDGSNRDRIVASFNSSENEFSRIYVTQHLDQSEFDEYHTCRISQGLISIIQNMDWREFMGEIYVKRRHRRRHRRRH